MFDVHVPKLVKVNVLNPAAYNPRSITPEKFEALKKSITVDGFVEPIVVQKKGMKIIGGHQRTRAVKELSIELGEAPPDLPAVVLDIDDVAAKKLNIKLNKVQGVFEARMLGELLVDIYDETKITADEASDLGFVDGEASKFIDIIEPPIHVAPTEQDGKTFGKHPTLSLEFSSPEARDRVKKLLADRSAVEKKSTGDLVAAMLAPKVRKPKLVKPAMKKRRAA